MENKPQHSKRVLPNTPRVSEKILEYYLKFGHDRDLEKFMRLYSPASSQDSQKTQNTGCGVTADSCMHTKSRETISSTSSCEALVVLPSRSLNERCVTNSKSLPNIDAQGRNTGEKDFSTNDLIVPVNIEMETDKEKVLSVSTEDLGTPKKIFKHCKTQTPESIAKSHRRLEWDSLGDVGYRKSMSTSNLSVLERSLLKEFFKEKSVTSEQGSSVQNKEEKRKLEENKPVQNIEGNTAIEHSTPPLACSTLVEANIRAKPKMISQSTSSTSLYKKFEKYAQTSLMKPLTVQSQEIQCTMSSSTSAREDTATPSSFEYYSSRSSKSKSSRSSNMVANVNSQSQINVTEHPFITSITDFLMKRKALCEKKQKQSDQLNHIRDLQNKFQAALDKNKENYSQSSTINSTTSTSISLSKQSPELDLGIQLICSLIDAKSVNVKQKKQLIRNIVKRITQLENDEQTSNSPIINSSETTSNSSNKNYRQMYDSVCSRVTNKQKVVSAATPTATEQKGIQVTLEKPCASNRIKSGIATASMHRNKNNIKLKPSSEKHFPSHFQEQRDIGHHYKEFPCKTKTRNENVLKENNTNVPNIAMATISTSSQNEKNTLVPNEVAYDNKMTSNAVEEKDCATLKENAMHTLKTTTRATQTSKTTTTNSKSSSATTASTSLTNSQDLATQRFVAINTELNDSNADAEQATMREWLNPLTQSEIEYEEKKREEIKKKAAADKREKLLKNSEDCGREHQLNWIESEIRRLECLKHLLLKDQIKEHSSTTVSSLDWPSRKDKNLTKDSTQTDKLYDTVYSDKSSVLSESAELLVKEIEIILEESHEDVVNLKDNLKRTKDRKKEVQIMYETEDASKNNCSNTKPKFRTMKETININEEQLLNREQRRQREKIDTPSSENTPPESESLKDLVQQRKREFMEAYKAKKQNHYEALKQQQEQEFKNLNIERKIHEKAATTTTTDSEHYSVPHIMPRKYTPKDLSYAYTQRERETKSKAHDSQDKRIICSTATLEQQQNSQVSKPINIETVNATGAATATTCSSSTSMFCLSSDASVAIGSHNAYSTSTTTHQYDDVATTAGQATGVAIQTSDSILRSKPIYGPKRSMPTLISHSATTSSTACIQVKPRGIAYVIEFHDNKHESSKTDINSNKFDTKSNGKQTSKSATTSQLTLQEHLEKSKPTFLQHSKERKAILNQLQLLRQERDRQLREIIENSSFNSLDRRLQHLPQPPTQRVRIFKTKTMKALTHKRFSSLPEVVAKREREIEERKRRGNRILRDVFNRRLQKRVRSGKLSLNHSKTVI